MGLTVFATARKSTDTGVRAGLAVMAVRLDMSATSQVAALLTLKGVPPGTSSRCSRFRGPSIAGINARFSHEEALASVESA